MQDPLNDNSERRLTLTFLFSFAILAVSLFFMPKPKNTVPPSTAESQTNVSQTTRSESNLEVQKLLSKLRYRENLKSTNISLHFENKIRLDLSTRGGAVSSLWINGDWNRQKTPVQLANSNLPFMTGDFLPGSYRFFTLMSNRPIYAIQEVSEQKARLDADFSVDKEKVRVLKSYEVLSNYRFVEKISVMNLGKQPLSLDLDGAAFSLSFQYDLMAGESANNRNPLVLKYFDGKKARKALGGAFLKKAKNTQTLENFRWIVMQNNYFMAVVEPKNGNFKGTFLRLNEDPRSFNVAFFLEAKPFILAPGETKSFEISYYLGPRKEKLLRAVNKEYGKLFSWPGWFNVLMKPIEWGIGALMFFLASFIPNWGVVVILLALIIKLLMSPLSINAAISMKRMHLLQPKIKNLQEKYKDDPQVQQQKLAELYKKEGVNPAGGCLPMLLQMPVFVVLFQFLNHLVEIKGAQFLWIKDLTQPDTLAKLHLPFMGQPFNFNLLPLLMVAFQLLSTYLQTGRQPAQQNAAMNPYLTPVIFLFFFWNMPSGLVLYWTIQNIYTIVEQEIINMDKYVKLK